MRASALRRLDRELTAFVDELFEGLVRPAGRQATGRYVEGLLLDGERKSIEPMAERLAADPSQVSALRQSLRFTVAASPWDEAEVFARLGHVLLERLPSVVAYVIDDTGFAKKGEHSVGVTRQYSGTLGRVDNCQVATSLHVAGEGGSGCIGFRLYLPEDWAGDAERRAKAGVPDDVPFETKWQLALGLLDRARAAGLPALPVLADAGYGDCHDFRQGLRERKLAYAVGIQGGLVFWGPGRGPVPPPASSPGRGRPRVRWTSPQPPETAEALALSLRYRTVTWREGSRGPQRSRFAAVRVRTAHEHARGRPPGDEEWLLVEWPEGEKKPTKYWLCSLPADTPLRTLVRWCKLRWRVERDYEDLKGELGLDHFEGRMWRGFHHHAALCAVAHAFLAIQRAHFPPGPDGSALDVAEGAPGAASGAAAPARTLPAVSVLA
jgi:SRSO17 transposase